MRKILFIIILAVGSAFAASMLAESSVFTASADDLTLPLIQNINAYESVSLNGDWNYIVDVQEEGYNDYRMKPTQWGFFRNAKPQRPEDLIATIPIYYSMMIIIPTTSALMHVTIFIFINI